MLSLFSFRGTMSRGRYALTAGAAFLAQYGVVLAVRSFAAEPAPLPFWFWLNPLRALLFSGINGLNPIPSYVSAGAALALMLSVWIVAAASVRRAREAGYPPLTMATLLPVVQIAAIIALCVLPKRVEHATAEQAAPSEARTRSIILGMVAGVVIGVGAVALTASWLHVYGFILFTATPLIIGFTTAYYANKDGDIGATATAGAMFASLALSAAALVLLAFEGLICILFASPIILVCALLGSVVGRDYARSAKRNRTTTMTVIALLPALLIGETFTPPRTAFESHESAVIDAAPDHVWRAITHMDPIPEPPGAPFNWGLAYPISGDFLGEGIGSVRRGHFSTGIAYERVTVWEPGRELAFVVLTNPPMMRELSPYEEINAPHINGYFRSTDVRFTITPLSNGSSRLDFWTRHELDIEPAFYWTPLARWMIHENKQRVIRHFEQQAESYSAQ